MLLMKSQGKAGQEPVSPMSWGKVRLRGVNDQPPFTACAKKVGLQIRPFGSKLGAQFTAWHRTQFLELGRQVGADLMVGSVSR